MQITEEQIQNWKQKHGEIFKIDVEDKTCYLKRPSRKALSFASQVGAKDPLKFNEIILKDCWIDGDEEIQVDDTLFLSASSKLAELIEVKEASLVKL